MHRDLIPELISQTGKGKAAGEGLSFLVIGYWLLGTCCWLLVAGCWLLVAGCSVPIDIG